MAYKKCLIATTKNLLNIDSVSFFTKDSNGEYKSNKYVYTTDILWTPADGAKQVTISGYIKCPVGKNYAFLIAYTDGTTLEKSLEATGDYVYQTLTSDASKTVSYIRFGYYSASNEVYVKNVQIEESSTATSYVPYGYLPSYKKIIKVNNNPVQLFIPSNTKTVAGVTITNNGDGSLTINGTGTGSSPYTNFTTISSNAMIYGTSDKLFISMYVLSGTCSNFYCSFSNTGRSTLNIQNAEETTYYSSAISSMPYFRADRLGFYVGNNVYSNFKIKINVINLTAMFGAGNEPLTVSEFRRKYPEAYYDYNLSQYLVSYRKNLITDGSTINLFNINNLTAYTPDNLPNTTSGVYDGIMITRAGNLQSQAFTGKTLKELCPNIEAGKTYVLSFKSDAINKGGQRLHLRTTERYWDNNRSLTLTENDLNSEVSFYANYPEFTVAYTWDIQIEEGSTATSYVPYQYL